MSPRISVVVLARTSSPGIADLLEGLAAQSADRAAFETLVAEVEDATTVAAAWNRAAMRASAPILLLLDPLGAPGRGSPGQS